MASSVPKMNRYLPSKNPAGSHRCHVRHRPVFFRPKAEPSYKKPKTLGHGPHRRMLMLRNAHRENPYYPEQNPTMGPLGQKRCPGAEAAPASSHQPRKREMVLRLE